MCLYHPDAKPMRKFGIGYKSLRERPDGTYWCYHHSLHAGTVQYPLNEWITDPNDGDATNSGSSAGYRTGFHISLDVKYLKEFCSGTIVKVRFRKVVATQTQDTSSIYGPQVVAREIMNLGEV